MGAGQTRALYKGPLEENGIFLTDEAVADAVAADKGFWDYVDAQVNAERIPDQNGVWTWKLSVRFLNQDGTPAVLDSVEQSTSRVTAEPYTFHRATKRKKGKGDGMKAVVAALQSNQAVMMRCLDAQSKIIEALPTMMREASAALREGTTAAAQAACTVAQTAAQESAKLLAAGTAPLQQALDRLSEHTKHETARADDATIAHAKLLTKNKDDDGDWADDALKLFTVGSAALKVVDKLKN